MDNRVDNNKTTFLGEHWKALAIMGVGVAALALGVLARYNVDHFGKIGSLAQNLTTIWGGAISLVALAYLIYSVIEWVKRKPQLMPAQGAAPAPQAVQQQPVVNAGVTISGSLLKGTGSAGQSDYTPTPAQKPVTASDAAPAPAPKPQVGPFGRRMKSTVNLEDDT